MPPSTTLLRHSICRDDIDWMLDDARRFAARAFEEIVRPRLYASPLCNVFS